MSWWNTLPAKGSSETSISSSYHPQMFDQSAPPERVGGLFESTADEASNAGRRKNGLYINNVDTDSVSTTPSTWSETTREAVTGFSSDEFQPRNATSAAGSSGGMAASGQRPPSATASVGDQSMPSPSLRSERNRQLSLLSSLVSVGGNGGGGGVTRSPLNGRRSDFDCLSATKWRAEDKNRAAVGHSSATDDGPLFSVGVAGSDPSVSASCNASGNTMCLTHASDGVERDNVNGEHNLDEKKRSTFYDEVDVGTISSLLASLQVDSTEAVNDDIEGDEATAVESVGNMSALNPLVRQEVTKPDARRTASSPVIAANSSESLRPPQQAARRSSTASIKSTRRPPIHLDPTSNVESGCWAQPPGGNSMQSSYRLSADNTYSSFNGNSVGLTISTSASGSAMCFSENSLRDAFAGSTISCAEKEVNGDGAAVMNSSLMAPLQLTRSPLPNVLAAFQSALLKRSEEAAWTGRRGEWSPDVGDTTSLRSGRAGNSTHRLSSWNTQPGGSVAAAHSCGIGADQGCPGAIAAAQENRSLAINRCPMERGWGFAAGQNMIPLDSTSNSDTFSLHNLSRRRSSAPQSISAVEHAATPDSAADRFLARETASVSGRPHLSASVWLMGENRLAVSHDQLQHNEGDVVIPVAAATYNGDASWQQRVDGNGCIAVVDPKRRKLHVPLSAIQETKALCGRFKTPSLCLLYQSGRCRQGDNCYQVHADVTTVARLRAEMENMPCCCFMHGDCNSNLIDRSTREERSLVIAGRLTVPVNRVACTAGLRRVLLDEEGCASVNPSLLCRLHGQPGGCRFGEDCKFLHVCCEILRNELKDIMGSHSTALAPVATPASAGAALSQKQAMFCSVSVAPNSSQMLVQSFTGDDMMNINNTNSMANSSGAAIVKDPPTCTLAQSMMGGPMGTAVATNDAIARPPVLMQAARLSDVSPVWVNLTGTGKFAPTAPAGLTSGSAGSAVTQFGSTASSSHLSSAASASFQPPPGPTPSAHSHRAQPSSLPHQLLSPPSAMVVPHPMQNSGSFAAPSTAGAALTLPALPPSSQIRGASLLGWFSVSTPSESLASLRTLSSQTNDSYSSHVTPRLPQPLNNSRMALSSGEGVTTSRNSAAHVRAGAAHLEGDGSGGFTPPTANNLPQQGLHPPPKQPHQMLQNTHSLPLPKLYLQQVDPEGRVSFVPLEVLQSFNS